MNNKIESALNTYISHSLDLRTSNLYFLKKTALDVWSLINDFHQKKDISSMWFRFYNDGFKCFIVYEMSVETRYQISDTDCDLFLIFNYSPDLMNMISVIANNSDLCSNYVSVDVHDDYGEIEFNFK